MKRKQLSPPPDASQDEARLHAHLQQAAHSAQQFNVTAPHLLQAQSANHFAPHQGSMSSQSSGGFHNSSYASSGGPSIGGSSYTSIDQHSSGAASPSSEQQHFLPLNSQDLNQPSINPVTRNPRAGPYSHPPPISSTTSPPPRKTNENPSQRSGSTAGTQSNLWICGCCPKKPKKFETQEQLSAHTNEKQYGCLFCSNRFKNKNEAERHQNSLHRRTHSWSCSVLANDYTAAFFPSTTIAPINGSPSQQPQQLTSGLAQYDICGYCGNEFPNEPVDWDERARHLNSSHKFGECNQSKKFYRADHFRQHLKHSHGGNSGKWTNSLENACVRDEQPAVSAEDVDSSSTAPQVPGAPVANMGNMGPPEMGQLDMGQHIGQPGNLGQVDGMLPGGIGSNIAPMDMSNIDPNIGIHTMANMVSVGNLGTMGPPQRQMQIQMQDGGAYNDSKEDI